MKSPAVLSALKTQKRSQHTKTADLPPSDKVNPHLSTRRKFMPWLSCRWPQPVQTFLLFRGKLIEPINPKQGELNHEA